MSSHSHRGNPGPDLGVVVVLVMELSFQPVLLIKGTARGTLAAPGSFAQPVLFSVDLSNSSEWSSE